MTLTGDQLRADMATTEWPALDALDVGTDGTCSLVLRVTPDLRWFEGHFPGQPVLPGIVQTHWAAELGKRLFAINGPFRRVDNLKFQTPVLPDARLTLRLDFSRETGSLRFRFSQAGQPCSEGRIVFAAGE